MKKMKKHMAWEEQRKPSGRVSSGQSGWMKAKNAAVSMENNYEISARGSLRKKTMTRRISS